jgi:Secretion system C-terminal sorting domain
MHEGRQPYFIDKVNTYCAVGYLMQQTGADDMARDIRATQNFSYLLDIHHPKLMNWVAHSGLSIDELALIQVPYAGPSPALITEMHYNNTGTDVNEYLEIRQTFQVGNGGPVVLPFDKILFYDQTNTLYKTMNITQMQHTGVVGGPGDLYFYSFPTNENFADIGYLEIINSASGIDKILSKVTYNGNLVAYDRLTNDVYNNTNPTYYTTNFNVGENETTNIGSSLTFCGIFTPGGWSLQSYTASYSTMNYCLTLPISLSKFDYTTQAKKVNLNWETESEISTHFFNVEKSTNGVDFETIGKVNAAGNSSSTKQYSFVDEKPNYLNHYRLKQVDVSGKISYSKILFVRVQQANPISIVENPVKNKLQLQLALETATIKSVVLYDIMGRQIKSFKGNKGAQTIDLSSIARGKYLIQLIVSDGQVFSTPFLKVE